MSTATVTSKGQITIPVDVRRALGLSPGSKIEFVERRVGAYEVVVVNSSIRTLKGALTAPRPLTIEDMDRVVGEAAVEQVR